MEPTLMQEALINFIEGLEKHPEYQKLKSLSFKEIEERYAKGYALYEQGNFSLSIDFFLELIIINPFEKTYWFALGAAYQQEKKYNEALKAWSLVAFLDTKDPFCHFHAAECLLSLKDFPQALLALNDAEKRSFDNKILNERIKTLKGQNYGQS
jgi:type III secretion system low calcium response chaperone LcrH/SycD